MAGDIYVLPDTVITVDIGSDPTIICGIPYVCFVDSIAFFNKTEESIKVNVYILREIDGQPIIAESFYQSINPKENVELLTKDRTLTLNYGDLLYAYSDFSGSIFNSFVVCRKLLELGGDYVGFSAKR